MARVKGVLDVSGSLKGVSIYTVRGSDQVIMRTKGGPSKQTIKTRESCKGLRDSGTEWSGCTKAASSFRRALEPFKRMADYNVMGGMNALFKQIQSLDTAHEKGRRNITVREHIGLLRSFNFNKTRLFDAVVRLQPRCEINRQTVSARVLIPAFNPAEQLTAPNKLPFMRFVVVLGVCTNVVYDETIKNYKPVNDQLLGYNKEARTEWFPVKRAMPEQVLEVQIDKIASYLTDDDTLVVGIGVEFGTVGADGQGEAVKWSGSARVLDVD